MAAALHGAAPLHPVPIAAEDNHIGSYRIGRLLGKGGMGEVHDADELATGRRVALKILSHRLDSPDARSRFLNEGRIAATINHPNSVYVFGAEEIAGVPVIAMELMPGGTLEDKVRTHGPLPVTEVADIALQIIDGLAAAHATGILHRDIKPSNCFIDADGSVKIGDYGLSISTLGHQRPQIGEDTFMGTPAFASPEQLRGDDLTIRSDIYSLGVTLFVLLTGSPPHHAKDPIRLLAKVLESPAPALSELRPDIPKGLAMAVHRCLAKRPDDRFTDCESLRAAIAPFSSRGKTAAQPWQRLVAAAVDMAMIGIPYLAASHLLSKSSQGYVAILYQSILLLCALIAWLAWFTLFEWKSGRTPGKALLRLEVRLANTEPKPWLAGLRILRRTSLFLLLPVAIACSFFPAIREIDADAPPFVEIFWQSFEGTQPRYHYEWHLGLPMIAAWAVATFLLFAGSHRRNGWLALHDQLTGTRVVSPARRETPRTAPRENRSLPWDGAPTFGPFHILEAVPDTADWHIGYDPKLLRKVWLRKQAPGAPPVAAALRHLRRPGRLRWLAGIRSPEENWDAYEFPGGQALVMLAEKRATWPELRSWMSDLAIELTAAAADGTRPASPSIEQIWITADGRAKLLDFPAPGIQPQSPPSHPSSLWLRLAQSIPDQHPLPLPVTAFLRKLGERQDPALLATELAHLATVPHEITRTRRLGLIATSAAGPVLLGLFLFLFKDTSLPAALFWSIAALLAFVAFPAIITAAWAGDGLIMRTLGICVVDRHGNPAHGALASRRSLIAWLPTLVSPLLFAALIIWVSPYQAAVCTLAALALLALVSAILPGKSLHDRIAGTWLVPR